MLPNLRSSRARRRGVVLIVILGMLGLLALIGVTFATFSGQAQDQRAELLAVAEPARLAEVMDYALAQLINDTGQPAVGDPGPQPEARHVRQRRHVQRLPGQRSLDGDPLMFLNVTQVPGPGPTMVKGTNVVGLYQCVTNIPLERPDRLRLRLHPLDRHVPRRRSTSGRRRSTSSQTFEVLVDDNRGQTRPSRPIFYVAPPRHDAYHVFRRQHPHDQPVCQPPDYADGAPPVFVLDGRYLHAFNGPGMVGRAVTESHGNVRPMATSGSTGPDGHPERSRSVRMDEDYDACDLENWFLAIQSADGQVIIPSFHRPGILRVDPSSTTVPERPAASTTVTNDWTNTSRRLGGAGSSAPAQVDGHTAHLVPRPHPRPRHRPDHLRRRQRRRRHHRLGLARPRLPAERDAEGIALQAPLRVHGHRPQRPAAAQHGGQPPASRRTNGTPLFTARDAPGQLAQRDRPDLRAPGAAPPGLLAGGRRGNPGQPHAVPQHPDGHHPPAQPLPDTVADRQSGR